MPLNAAHHRRGAKLASLLKRAYQGELEALSAARAQRFYAYNGIDGLKAKFTGMKQAIKGQYTPPSTQWTQVKGLLW